VFITIADHEHDHHITSLFITHCLT